MSLKALLASLESRAVTPVTADVRPSVTPKPAPVLACTSVTPVTSENDDTASSATSEPLPDPAVEIRRQRVLAMLAERQGIHYAVVVDNPDTDTVAVAVGIRDVMQDRTIVTCEVHIPSGKYDPFLLFDLIERHTGTVH